jgi:hypothetical protein
MRAARGPFPLRTHTYRDARLSSVGDFPRSADPSSPAPSISPERPAEPIRLRELAQSPISASRGPAAAKAARPAPARPPTRR